MEEKTTVLKKTKITDMTVGSPTKHLLKFALPLFMGNLFQQLYNLVDSVVVGNFVGKDALAAVGTCGSMNFLFFSLSSGLAIGIGIIVSQYFGAKEYEKVKKTIGNSFLVVLAASLAVSLLSVFCSPWLLRLLKTPDEIFIDSRTYAQITALGIIGIALYNLISAILRALGDSRTPLYFLILSSIINLGLDLLFVIGFGWEVFGVAYATIIAQYVSAIACFIYAVWKVSFFKLNAEHMKPSPVIIGKSVRNGMPIALQNSMIAVSCMALQGFVNDFGTTVMAAYTIISRIEQLVQQPYGSLGTALTSYCGQNMGARKYDRVRKGFNQATLIVLIFSLIMLPIFYIFGFNIVSLFVRDEGIESIRIGTQAVRITSLFYFALGMIYVPRAVLNGCGDTKFAMINGVTEVACRLIYAPIFTSIPFLGYWGIWVTTGATWLTTGIVCVIRYKRGKWLNSSLVEEDTPDGGYGEF